MFASLAYADLEKIESYDLTVDSNMNDKPKLNFMHEIKAENLTFNEYDMVTDDQLRTIESSTVLLGLPLSGIGSKPENTYDYLFYGMASTSEVSDWKLVNYTKYNTTIFKGTAAFTAMTFKRDNDIVIAYRGTDFDDAGDWIQDLLYGLLGHAGQEGVAQDYARAVAKHYANENPNIYITGHSLGGYLAQIGGAALVDPQSGFSRNVKEISYFNGMGLKFWSNLGRKITANTALPFGIDKNELNQFLSDTSPINIIQNKAQNNLRNWKNNGGILISHNIKGDLISSLGTHVGDRRGYDPYNMCINHHQGNQILLDGSITSGILGLIKDFLNEDVSVYVKNYRPAHILKYVWITHETDSFFGRLPYADGTEPADVTVKLDVPSTIKYNKTANATLTINTKNSSLNKASLTKDDFITNISKVKVNSVKLNSTKRVGNGYEYTYTVQLKGGLVVGNSNIVLRPGAITLTPINRSILSNVIANLSNNVFESASIKTKLR